MLSPTPPAEPLINHNIPQGPWKNTGADFMDWDGKGDLLIIDYFFMCPFLFQMPYITTNTVIRHLHRAICP